MQIADSRIVVGRGNAPWKIEAAGQTVAHACRQAGGFFRYPGHFLLVNGISGRKLANTGNLGNAFPGPFFRFKGKLIGKKPADFNAAMIQAARHNADIFSKAEVDRIKPWASRNGKANLVRPALENGIDTQCCAQCQPGYAGKRGFCPVIAGLFKARAHTEDGAWQIRMVGNCLGGGQKPGGCALNSKQGRVGMRTAAVYAQNNCFTHGEKAFKN
jgi:hypothetical protein